MKRVVIKYPCKSIYLCVLILASCASVDVAKMKTLPPKSENCQIDVLTKSSAVKRKYEVACILGSSTGTTLLPTDLCNTPLILQSRRLASAEPMAS